MSDDFLSRLGQFLTQFDDAVLLLDTEQRLCHLSCQAEALLTLSADHLMGAKFLELFVGDEVRTLMARDGTPHQVLGSFGNSRTPLLATARPLPFMGYEQYTLITLRPLDSSRRPARPELSSPLDQLARRVQHEFTLDTPLKLVQNLFHAAVELIPDAQRGSLLIRNGQHYDFVAAVGWPMEELATIRIPLEERRTAAFLSGQRLVRSSYATSGLDFQQVGAEARERFERMGSNRICVTLSAPIFVEGELYGMMNLDNLDSYDAFDSEAEQSLILFASQAAVAVKYRRTLAALETTTQQARAIADEQSLLARLTSLINSSVDYETVLRSVVETVAQEFGAGIVAIVKRDTLSRRSPLGFISMLRMEPQGFVAPEYASGYPIEIDTSRLLEGREPYVLVQAPYEHPELQRFAPYLRRAGVKQVALFPLLVAQELIGVFVLTCSRSIAFCPGSTLSLLATVSSHIAVTLERADLYRQSQRRLQHVEALRRVSMQITRSLELETLLDLLTQSVLDLVGGESATLFFYDSARREYTLAKSVNRAGSSVPISVPPRSDGLTAQVGRQREVIAIEDTRTHPLFRDRVGQGWPLASIIGVPVTMGHELIGVLHVGFSGAPHALADDELHLLELFAANAAVALNNAQLFEKERRHRQGLERMNATTLSLIGARDQNIIFEQALDGLCKVLRAPITELWLDEEQCVPLMGRGAPARERDPECLRHFTQRYYDSAEPQIHNHLEECTPFGPEWPVAHALLVPLRSNVVPPRTLAAYRTNPRTPFTVDDLRHAITVGAQVTLASENAFHLAQATQRADQLVAFNDVMIEVSRETEQQRLLSYILRHATALLNASEGLIVLRRAQRATPFYISAAATRELPPVALAQAELGVLALALRGESLLLEEHLPPPMLKRYGIQGHLAVAPLTVEGEVSGMVVLARAVEAAPFTPNDLWMLELLGKQIGVSVQRAQMFEEMQRQIEGLDQLRAAKQSISQQLEMGALEQNLLDQAGLLSGCEPLGYFAVMASGPDSDEPTIRLTHGTLGSLSPLYVAELVEEALREATLTTFLIPDAPQGVYTLLLLPLYLGSQPRGCIVLGASGFDPIDRHGRHILHLFAAQAATALENARLYQRSQEVQQFNENIIQWMDEGILLLGATGAISFANAAAQRMLGRSLKELRALPLVELVHPEDEQRLRSYLSQHRRGGSGRYELRVVRSSGETIPLLISAKGMLNSQGALNMVLCVLTDMTERKRLERQLIQAEKLSAIGELVSGVAHELNNPLTSIIGYAQLLHMGMADGDVRRDLERIGGEARRATRIVRNLLAFARKSHAEKSLIDINQLLHNSVDLRGYYLRRNNIEVLWELDPSLPAVNSDPHQMQQVFMNLLTNAEQAISESGREGQIVIRTERRVEVGRDWARITLMDNGSGIPTDILPHIFDPFFTTKEVGFGTGLGLSICYGIIQQHGGTIEVESTVGQGSRFVITLPIRRGPTLGALAATHTPAVSPPAPLAAHALVVDDEPSITTIVSQLLRLHGHQVTTAPSAQEAIRLMEEQPYDLLLIDLNMPEMGGDQLFDWLRANRPEQAERVLFMTGDTIHETSRAFLEASGRPHIEKPFRLEELLALVERLLHAQALKP